MIRSLWIAKTGMDAQQTQLDVISNNLANVGTNGYKRQVAAFEDLLYQNVRQAGANSSQQTQLPTGLQLGTGVQLVATPDRAVVGHLLRLSGYIDLAIPRGGEGLIRRVAEEARMPVLKHYRRRPSRFRQPRSRSRSEPTARSA